jgi:hypothetical protein
MPTNPNEEKTDLGFGAWDLGFGIYAVATFTRSIVNTSMASPTLMSL